MTIKTSNGGSSIRPLSNAIKLNIPAVWRTALWLAALGFTGVIMHAILRVPLHLPGHHGLEWMALLVIARFSVPYRGAIFATGVSATAFATLPFWGWHDPFTPLMFVITAFLFDTLYAIFSEYRYHRILIMLSGGLVFALAGFVSFIAGPHGATIHALWLTWFLSHFIFGLLGTLAGLQLTTWSRSRTES